MFVRVASGILVASLLLAATVRAGDDPGTGRYLLSLASSTLPAATPAEMTDVLQQAFHQRFAEIEPLLRELLVRGDIEDYTPRIPDGIVEIGAPAEGAGALMRVLGEDGLFSADTGGYRAAGAQLNDVVARSITPDLGERVGAAGLTAQVTIGYSYVSGTVAPTDAVVFLRVYDRAGRLLGAGRARAESGYYIVYLSALQITIAGGYVLRLQSGAESLVLEVPPLSVEINRQTDVVTGRGPRGKPLIVTLTHYVWTAALQTSTATPLGVIVDGRGRYSQDFTVFGDITGGDYVEAKFTYPETANSVRRIAYPPQVWGYLDSGSAGGYALPGRAATFAVKDRRGRQVFSALVRGDSYFGAFSLQTFDGAEGVSLRDGTTLLLNLPGVAARLPKLSARLDAAGAKVNGSGPPDALIQVNTYQPYKTYYGQIGADGRFSIDVSAGGAIVAATYGTAALRLDGGDLAYRAFR